MTAPPQIGPYTVVRELGRGGMGAVYEVKHPSFPRRLAMKVMLEGANAEALQRFGREAETLAKLSHPGVVTVHSLGRGSQGPYLVTELVEGTELKELIDREGCLEAERAATVARAVADALAAVHAEGVLHRDLKPHNVIIRPDGSPVVLDFGLAVAPDSERLTQTGQVLGTPAYMPPEQAGGEKIRELTPESDVYGLGATLFHMLKGYAPFHDAGGALQVMAKILTSEPEWPSAVVPTVPANLEAVVRKAMAKEPTERYASAAELSADLDRFLSGEPTLASQDWRLPRWIPRAALVLVALALLAGGVWIADVVRDSNAEAQARKERQEREQAKLQAQHERLARAQKERVDLDALRREQRLYPYLRGARRWLERYPDHSDHGKVQRDYQAVLGRLPLQVGTLRAKPTRRNPKLRGWRKAAFWGNHHVVAALGADAPVRLWDVSDPQIPQIVREWALPEKDGTACEARCVATFGTPEDGRCLVAFYYKGGLIKELRDDGTLVDVLDSAPNERVLSGYVLQPTPDGEGFFADGFEEPDEQGRYFLYTFGWDGGDPTRRYGPFKGHAWSLDFTKDGQLALATGGTGLKAKQERRNAVTVWKDWSDPQGAKHTIRFDDGLPNGMAFTASGKLVAGISYHKVFVVAPPWPDDLKDVPFLRGEGAVYMAADQPASHDGSVQSLVALGERVISASGETNDDDDPEKSELRVWDLERGKLVRDGGRPHVEGAEVGLFDDLNSARKHLTLSPDGALMVVSVREYQHELWLVGAP